MSYRGLYFPEHADGAHQIKRYAFYGGLALVEFQIQKLVDKMIKNHMYVPPKDELY